MSDLLLELFHAAMDKLPYTPSAELTKAEEALEERLDQEGKAILRAWEEAWNGRNWEESKQLFYMALALGIELGRLTPSADACRRSG